MTLPSARSTARPLLLWSALILTGCGGGGGLSDSWVNPGNWFGQSRSEAISADGIVNPLIPKQKALTRKKVDYQGTPVAQIKSLRIERKPGGAIVHVVGVSDGIGYYDVRLQQDNDGMPVDGVLSYTLKAVRSKSAIRGGSEAARQINAARYISNQELKSARKIIVIGAQNQRSTRRR
ncbi:hypothetical protein [Planktotalea sp.]|uniref:hypothetical protein n=1 Tax=Planktotalea sp. TaxID=2029877 RepID=UPI0025EADB1A|nr:hypothetical protein [Planktotalea sp.]